jgi:hypothetical protein
MRELDGRFGQQSAGRRSVSNRGPTVQATRPTPAASPGRSIDDLSPQTVMNLQNSAGNTMVQRMFKRWKAAVTGSGPASAEETLRVGNEVLPVTRRGAFYIHRTHDGATVYIHDIEVREGVLSAGLAAHVQRYLAGGLALYRGIARWHPTWHDVRNGRAMNPLGSGEAPDFDTSNTSFIPFSPDERVARAAAVGKLGMGKRDRIEYVDGYTRSNGNFPVGLLATTVVGPNQDVAFFNETEIQLRGPVHRFQTQLFRMSTDVMEALTGTAGVPPEPFSKTHPEPPNEAQKQAFRDEHGSLLP